MSEFDGLLACFGICFCCCCCLEGVQNNNHWCFLSCCGTKHRVRGQSGGCCSCKRAMTDDDFERTVEQLYGQNKPENFHGQSTHVVELQPVRSDGGGGGDSPGTTAVNTQPRPRRSMEAPARRSGSESRSPVPGGEEDDRERAMLESRKDAKTRTLEWVVTQGSSVDVSRLPSEQDEPAGSQSRTHRPHRSEPNTMVDQGRLPSSAHRQRASEAHPGQSGRASAHSRSQEQDDRGGDADMLEHAQRGPRLDIPSSLMPGRTHSATPTQLPFDMGPGQDRTSPTGQVQSTLPSSPPDHPRGAP